MKTISLEINGKTIKTEKGKTILEVARANDIHIPTLCSMEGLKPYGACRLCLVELHGKGAVKYVASCLYEAQEGLVVKTDTPKLLKIRKLIAELLYPAQQGLSPEIRAESTRFVPELTDCTLCGKCVRYCSEIMKKDCIYFKGRGINRKPAFSECFKSECSDFQDCYSNCASGRMVQDMMNFWGGK